MDRYGGGPANGISGETPGLEACDGGGRRGWRVEDEEEVDVAVKSALSSEEEVEEHCSTDRS